MAQQIFERDDMNFYTRREKREMKRKKFTRAYLNLCREHASHQRENNNAQLPILSWMVGLGNQTAMYLSSKKNGDRYMSVLFFNNI